MEWDIRLTGSVALFAGKDRGVNRLLWVNDKGWGRGFEPEIHFLARCLVIDCLKGRLAKPDRTFGFYEAVYSAKRP